MGDSRSSFPNPPNLGSSDSPAASALASLDQVALLHWSQECKDAIDLWCCCKDDAGTNSDAPSITTSWSRTLASTVYSAFHLCILVQEVNMVFRR